MNWRERFIVALWVLFNVVGLSLIAFADAWWLRGVGVLMETAAISVAGLISIGGMFGAGDDRNSDRPPDSH